VLSQGVLEDRNDEKALGIVYKLSWAPRPSSTFLFIQLRVGGSLDVMCETPALVHSGIPVGKFMHSGHIPSPEALRIQ
jgi:hypothetical protein